MVIGIDAHNLEGKRTGVGRYLANLLQQWSKFEIQNNLRFILYFHKKIPDDEFLQSPIFEKKLLRFWPKPSFLIYFLFLLPRAFKKDRVDLAFFPCYMVPFTYTGRSVMVIHDLAYEAFPEVFPLRYKIPYRIFSRYGSKKSKAIITVSEFSKKEIERFYGISPEKIFVTPLGVAETFKQISDELILEKIKQKYGIEKNFILHLGQIFYRRHVLESIAAFKKIAGDFPDFQFLLIGKNWLKEDLGAILKEVNSEIGREVLTWKLFAPDDELVLLYNAASLVLYLSDYEGFGLPPLEAMACGTPVLTTNFASLKETAGDCAIIVNDPKNIDEIAKKISKGLLDFDLREKIIEKGLKNVQKYSWERCASQTLRILLNCLPR